MPVQYNNIKSCTRCKTIYSGDISLYFYKKKGTADKYAPQCKTCIKEGILKQRLKNIEYIREYNKEHHGQRREQHLIKRRINNRKFASYNLFAKKLGRYNQVGENEEGYLLVECHNCGKHMIPTNMQVRSRLRSIIKTGQGDANFYCSQKCKDDCPIFSQQKTPKGVSPSKEARDVPAWLITEVKDRDNWTCQRCLTKNAPLEVHHILPYTQNKVLGCDKYNLITYCKKCHKKIHKKPGMRGNDLGCTESTLRE